MSAADPAVAAVRRAVRRALDGLPGPARRAPLLVACSGGADSTALLAAARAAAPGRVHVAVVDHGLQDGSAERSAALVAGLIGAGRSGGRAHAWSSTAAGGVEAAARRARYAALRAARPHPDSPVLLGHTLDDQAETVLLGLGRGSGARSLAGMRDLGPAVAATAARACAARTPAAACRAQGLPFWDDPHNVDPRFTRVRLRHEVLPLLEEVLAAASPRRSPAPPRSCATTARRSTPPRTTLLARGVPERRRHTVQERATRGDALDAGALDAAVLAAAPAAVRRRALRCLARRPRSHRAHRLPPARRRRSRRPLARSGRRSRCRSGWSWFASVGGFACARRRGRAPDEVRPRLRWTVDAARTEPQEDPPCTTGTSRPC